MLSVLSCITQFPFIFFNFPEDHCELLLWSQSKTELEYSSWCKKKYSKAANGLHEGTKLSSNPRAGVDCLGDNPE